MNKAAGQDVGQTFGEEFGAKDLVFLASWMALVTGLVEGVALLVSQHTGRLNSNVLLWVSAPILWISPLASLLLFGVTTFGLVLLRRVWAKAWNGILVVGLFCLIAVYDWMTVAAAGRIHHYALVLLSLGCASVVARQIASRRLRMVRLCRRSLPWLVATVAILIFVVQGGAALWERIDENALASTAPDSPGILLIVVDALRADHLSSYGYTRMTSPHLDKIVKEGVLFENAFATSSWTLPSHTSLLTGRYLHEHLAGDHEPSFDGRYPVIPAYLKDRGYRTGAFSANTTFFAQGVGLGRGFIHFEDIFRSVGDMWVRTAYGREFYNVLHRLGVLSDIPGRRRAAEMSQAVLDWIDRDGKRPFFAMVNFIDAHEPYASPGRFSSKFTELNEAVGGGSEHPTLESQRKINAYDGAVAYVDDEIGRLHRELQKRRNNTLVLITSDHGELFGEHGQFEHGHSLYREVIRVPLIAWWPGHIPANLRIEQDVSAAAIPATVLSLIGEAQQKVFPGPSLDELWTGSSEASLWPYPLTELTGSLQSKSLVSKGWHYIRDENLDVEIYDWSRDPKESVNLARTPQAATHLEVFSSHLDRLLAKRP